MMKTIFESWRSYTSSLLNEELLIESLAQAEDSVIKRATKLIKGWVYNFDKTAYDYIEQKAKKDLEDEWGADSFDQIKDYAFSWSIGGHLIFSLIINEMMPRDITDPQKKVALLWNYRMLTEQKVVHLDTLLKNIFLFIAEEYQKRRSSIRVTDLTDRGSDVYMLFKLQELRRMERDIYLHYVKGEYHSVPKKNLIERFFQWNRFIRDGKRDLNSISDYDELYELVQEAEPLFKEWLSKQENKDAEKGKEYLFEDERWKIYGIHSPSAAREFAKKCNAQWCTGAPGVGEKYFNQYYRPEDPLFAVEDKANKRYYQFHFGSQQYMDEADEGIQYGEPKLFNDIISVLDKVVPEKYQIARNAIKKFIFAKNNPHLDPNTGERW